MSLFKKFTDACAWVTTFMGGLFLIQKYMAFKPKTYDEYIKWISSQPDYSKEYVEGLTEAPGKMSQFLTPELTQNNDYRPMVILVSILIISCLVGLFLKRFPYVCFAVSLLPLITATYLFCEGTLFNQPSLFIMLTLLHVLGNAVECILRDREDGRHRLWLSAKISMFVPALVCLVLTVAPNFISEEGIDKKLSIFHKLLFDISPELFDMLIVLGIMYVVVMIISALLLNVYFIDMILSFIPLGYVLYQLYNLKFSPFIAILLILAAVCFVTNLLLCIFENNLSQKEQKALAEEEAAKKENKEAEENNQESSEDSADTTSAEPIITE